MIDRPASILCIVVDKLEINVDLSAATVWIPSKLFRERIYEAKVRPLVVTNSNSGISPFAVYNSNSGSELVKIFIDEQRSVWRDVWTEILKILTVFGYTPRFVSFDSNYFARQCEEKLGGFLFNCSVKQFGIFFEMHPAGCINAPHIQIPRTDKVFIFICPVDLSSLNGYTRG